MARSRGRSRGPSLPALGGTLGSLVRSTLAQAGAVKDVLERGAREGKHRLDEARRERRREQALARLGEAVLDALRAGDAPELMDRTEVADAIAELEELERGEARGGRDDAWVAPATRERYDRDEDDGTVSASAWRPPPRARADERGAGRGQPVWRPYDAAAGRGGERHDADEPGARFAERRAADEPGARFAERRAADEPGARFAEQRKAGEGGARAGDRRAIGERGEDRGPPARRPADEPGARIAERRRPGGIHFDRDDDEDLAEYMHPDDLPPRPPKGS
jgi:hypothetical protein